MQEDSAMLIREYMTSHPITVTEDTSVSDAAKLMKERGVRRFPVMRNEHLIGIITDRDLRSAAPSGVVSLDVHERELMPELHAMLSNTKIKGIMSRDVVTIGPEQSVGAAALLMLKHRISGMPVVDSRGKLLGIITESDIFKVLVDFCGIHLGKTVLGLRIEDSPGSIKEVADVMREHGARLASILTSYDQADPQYRRVYVRIRDLPLDERRSLEEILRKRFELLYVIEEDVGTT
jgi:acetoin utilization protein AcuB